LEDGQGYDLLAAYGLMTYYVDMFQSVPYLLVEGPPGSGKSQGVGRGMKLLARRPILTTGLTEAQVYLQADASRGGPKTLIIDEGDLSGESDRQIVRLLNAGYARGYSVTRRYGDQQVEMDPFGPKVILRNSKLRLGALWRRCVRFVVDKAPNSWVRKEPDLPTRLIKVIEVASATVVQHYKGFTADISLNHNERDVWGPLLAVATAYGHKDELLSLLFEARQAAQREEVITWHELARFLLLHHSGEALHSREIAELLRGEFGERFQFSEDRVGRMAAVTFPSRVVDGRSVYLLKRWHDLGWFERRQWRAPKD
jgi:hypothetical protein